MKARLLTLSLLILLLAGCYYDNEEELYNCAADPATTKYSTTIAPILTSYSCTGCHSGASPSGGYNLTIYSGVKTVAENGKLWGAINHLPGFSPMPQGGGKMSGCDIKKIKTWIDAGAANN